MDILKDYESQIDYKLLKKFRAEFKKKFITSQTYSEYFNFSKKKFNISLECNVDSDKIIISNNTHLSDNFHKELEEQIKLLAPWRVGPYKIFDYEIESEWNSFYKFNRLKEFIPNIKNKIVADIGGNNGYFSFRLSAYDPKLIVLAEPGPKNYFQYQLLQKFLKINNIVFEPVKAENFSIFNNLFDVIFCLGVIYHQRNPLMMLNECYKALNKNGIIILETIVYDDNKPIALCPRTYQKMRNIWFLPTPSCLKRWLEVSNFEILNETKLVATTFKEQHKTKDATFESLEDFLDKDNPKLTIEGYHAPKRYIVVAKKKVN